jgi:hypothetical protein
MGVGVVGLCWKRNREVGVNVQRLAERLQTLQSYTDFVRCNGTDEVMNLSWDQFNEVKHRGAVFAWPIRNRRQKFIGCISVDASHSFDQLDTREFHEQLGSLCDFVEGTGFEHV